MISWLRRWLYRAFIPQTEAIARFKNLPPAITAGTRKDGRYQ